MPNDVQKHFWKEHLCALQVFMCARAHMHSLEGILPNVYPPKANILKLSFPALNSAFHGDHLLRLYILKINMVWVAEKVSFN